VAFIEDGRIVKKDKVGTLWDKFNWNNVSKEGSMPFPNGKKPIAFIQRMLRLCSSPEKDDLILDFFAGSGSVAHAVFEQNRLDSGSRRWISVQLPEPIGEKHRAKLYSKDEFTHLETISDIGQERIRRAARRIQKEAPNYLGDLGFRLFRVSSADTDCANTD
jgi:adenine-specific DNA-methyltransferase